MVKLVTREKLVPLVILATQENKEHRDQLVTMAEEVKLASKVQLVTRVLEELKVLEERMVFVEKREIKVNKV
jgi:hypothetical protein